MLIARQKKKGETTTEYFHDMARMCRELKLDFNESKWQIVEGIYSHELCIDIVTFTKINESQTARF